MTICEQCDRRIPVPNGEVQCEKIKPGIQTRYRANGNCLIAVVNDISGSFVDGEFRPCDTSAATNTILVEVV